MDGLGAEVEENEDALPIDFAEKWLNKIRDSSKEEEIWRKEAKKICNIYVPKNTKAASYYNVLYSNTETLLPLLYSKTPRPDVRRRYGDADKLAKFAGKLIERNLSYQLSEYDADYEMEMCILDGLLTGRGVIRVNYKPITKRVIDPLAGEYEKLIGECADWEYVKWEDFRRSAGKIWADVTWIAFRSFLTRADAAEAFGEEMAAKLQYNVVANEAEDSVEAKKSGGESNRAVVWEIWDKITEKVIYVSEGYTDEPLKVEPPVVNFKHFFCIPRPLQFILRTDSLVPYPEYQEYREQADQLVKISRRIARITDALKVRGIYDSTMKELERLFDADDNDMLPADNVAAMYEKGGIDKMVWLLPIQDLAAALNYLYQQRETVKAVIFEISGVSDVLKGATKASETLGAQEMKAQYANTRLSRRQKEARRFVRDLFRLQAEVIAEKFSPETIARVSNVTAEELQQAGVDAAQVEMLLRDDTIRDYKIDVESDSMIAAEDKDGQAMMAEFLQAINQFFGMVAPLIQQKLMPFEVAKNLLMAVSRKFKVGADFEDALNAMQEPPESQPDPLEMKRLEIQNKQVDNQARKDMADVQLEKEGLQIEGLRVVNDIQGKRQESQQRGISQGM